MLVQDFLKLSLISSQLHSSRIALNSRDFLVWLALSGAPRVVLLALVEVAVDIALLVAVALGKRSFSSSF
jgi:hypothetical protein